MVLDSLFSYSPPAQPMKRKKNEVDYSKNPTKLFKRLEGKAWDSVLERIQTNGIESKIWVYKTAYDGSVTWKRLPLHEACIHKPSPTVVEALLRSYPNSASKRDADGRLPLHHACANGASLEVVEQLLFSYPDAMNMEDCWKKTPLQTLMGQYFPDPHCISALKRGPEYYNYRRTEDMAPLADSRSVSSPSLSAESYRNNPGQNLSQYQSSNSSVARPNSRAERTSPERRVSIPRSVHRNAGPQNSVAEKQMISGLEVEIGRISGQLALANDEISEKDKKVRQLQSEVNRLLGLENENATMSNDIRTLEDELRLVKDTHMRERENYENELQHLDDVKRSEERLKRELDGVANDPRPRMLEDKVDDLSRNLQESESRYDRDMRNLKLALENSERDTDAAKARSNEFQDEINRLGLENKRFKYEKDSDADTVHDLRNKVSRMDVLESNMASLERERRDQEDRVRHLSNQLQHAEEDNAMLREDTANISRMQGELHSQSDYIHDLKDKLNKSEDKFAKLSDTLNAKERIDTEVETSRIEEKNNLKQTIVDLKIDLEKSQKQVVDLGVDKAELEKRLQNNGKILDQVRSEKEDIQRKLRRELKMLNELQSTVEEKIGTYRTRLVEEQTTSKAHVANITSLEEEVAQLRNNVQNSNSTNSESMRELLNLQRTLKDHEATIERLNSEKEQLEADADKAQSSLQNLEQTVLGKQQQIDVISFELDKAKSEKTLLQHEHEGETAKLQQTCDELHQKIHYKDAENAVTEKGKLTYMSQSDELKKEAEAMKKEMHDLEKKNASSEKEAEGLLQDKRVLEGAKKDLEERLFSIMMERPGMFQRNAISNAGVENVSPQFSDQGYNFVGQEIEFHRDQNEDNYSSDLNQDLKGSLEKLEKLEKENEMLRALLEDDDKSENSLSDLEERLFNLEETKDAEIAILAQEREELLTEITSLKDRIQMLEGEVKRLKADKEVRENHIGKLRQKRDRKKKTIEDRLKVYESMSCAGSVVPMEKIRSRMEKDETASTVSAMTSMSMLEPQKRIGRSKSENSDLKVIFPSSVSVTGLSIAGRSTASITKPVSSKGRQYRASNMHDMPSTVTEDRDDTRTQFSRNF